MNETGEMRGLCGGVSPGSSTLLLLIDLCVAEQTVMRPAFNGEGGIMDAKVYASGAVLFVGNDLHFRVCVLNF